MKIKITTTLAKIKHGVIRFVMIPYLQRCGTAPWADDRTGNRNSSHNNSTSRFQARSAVPKWRLGQRKPLNYGPCTHPLLRVLL
jgi:hypothetical protein